MFDDIKSDTSKPRERTKVDTSDYGSVFDDKLNTKSQTDLKNQLLHLQNHLNLGLI